MTENSSTLPQIKIASNRLKIFGLVKEDQGVYQCFADNEIGSAQASAQLLVDSAGEFVIPLSRASFSPSQKYCHGFTPCCQTVVAIRRYLKAGSAAPKEGRNQKIPVGVGKFGVSGTGVSA